MDRSAYWEDFDSELAVSRSDEPRPRGRCHIHRDFEILYVVGEGVHCLLNDRPIALRPRTLLLFNHMDLHVVYSEDGAPCSRYVVYFKPEIIDGYSSPSASLLHCFYYRPFPDPQLLELEDGEDAALRALLDTLCAASAHAGDEYGGDLHLKFQLGELLLVINRLYLARHGLSARNVEEVRRIYDVIRYIHRHYAEELTLDALSAHFFLSKSVLSGDFRRVAGVSPIRYLNQCRMMNARQLLAAQHSVDEVCALVGYHTLSHFSQAFKRSVGVSPKQYQLAHRDPV